jgi:hypothetical protein
MWLCLLSEFIPQLDRPVDYTSIKAFGGHGFRKGGYNALNITDRNLSKWFPINGIDPVIIFRAELSSTLQPLFH